MSRASLTSQQALAVHTRRTSVVLSSGAGCGKTHVLTARYLAHLRDDKAEVGQVVAITFTDRAARQMRGRIRTAVEDNLRAADPADADAETWTRHLRNLETAPISTIHAFCAALLRQHAIEAGLDPRFDVLEEVLSVNIEAEALNSCLQRLLTAQTEAGEDLRQLILLYGWRPVVEAVKHLLRTRDETGWRQWLDQPPEQIAADWCDHARRDLRPRWLTHLLSARPRVTRCLDLLRRHPPLPGPMADNVHRLLEELPCLPEAADLGAAVKEFHELAKVGRVGKKAWPDPEVYEAIKTAFEKFRDELGGWELERFDASPDDLREAVEVGRRMLHVAGEAVAVYRERKRVHGVVDFQDLLTAARDLVRDHAAVRGRLRERYRFLLIDELQDTDPVQMELVEALCGAGLTEGRLFAVGDANQSIYRFRGADVHQFRALHDKMPPGGQQSLTKNFRSQPKILHFANALFGQCLTPYHPLETDNPQVNPGPCVEFLWSPRADGDSATEGRAAEAATIAQRIAALVRGAAEIVVDRSPHPDPPPRGGRESNTPHPDPPPRGGRESNTPHPDPPPQGGRESNTPHPDPPPQGGRGILSPSPLVGEGRGGGKLRPVRAGDVVLLFRAMSHVALYEAALRTAGLDYYLVGGRAFFAQQEIYDLLNLLRALENPQDGVSLAGVLRSPFCCVSDEALFVLGRRRDGLWAGLCDETAEARLPADQREPVRRARRHLRRWRGLKDRLPIARLLGAVFADSGYDAATQFEYLGDRKLANLWKLQDLARTFDRSGLFGLAEFIARLGDFVHTQAREEQAATLPAESDVVKLMTIHQAKGLEYPVVIVPDLAATGHGGGLPVAAWDRVLGCTAKPPTEDGEDAFSPFAWKLWQSQSVLEEWQEDLRTLYVACTRAQDYLILSSALPDGYQPAGPWMQTLAARFDLDTGRCLAPDVAEARRPAVQRGGGLPSRPAPLP